MLEAILFSTHLLKFLHPQPYICLDRYITIFTNPYSHFTACNIERHCRSAVYKSNLLWLPSIPTPLDFDFKYASSYSSVPGPHHLGRPSSINQRNRSNAPSLGPPKCSASFWKLDRWTRKNLFLRVLTSAVPNVADLYIRFWIAPFHGQFRLLKPGLCQRPNSPSDSLVEVGADRRSLPQRQEQAEHPRRHHHLVALEGRPRCHHHLVVLEDCPRRHQRGARGCQSRHNPMVVPEGRTRHHQREVREVLAGCQRRPSLRAQEEGRVVAIGLIPTPAALSSFYTSEVLVVSRQCL